MRTMRKPEQKPPAYFIDFEMANVNRNSTIRANLLKNCVRVVLLLFATLALFACKNRAWRLASMARAPLVVMAYSEHEQPSVGKEIRLSLFTSQTSSSSVRSIETWQIHVKSITRNTVVASKIKSEGSTSTRQSKLVLSERKMTSQSVRAIVEVVRILPL